MTLDRETGPERATISDVAREVGVSISTVSAALNGKPGVSEGLRGRIRSTADAMGFVPSLRARSLSSRRAFAVGLVVQRSPEVLEHDPFFASFIGGIESVLSHRDYALVLQLTDRSAETLRHFGGMISGRRVDGMFLNELETHDGRVDLAHRLGAPVVAINAGVDTEGILAVRQDHDDGIRRLANYLVGVGHRRFAFVEGPAHLLHSRQRLESWSGALEALGVEPGETFVGDFSYEGGRTAADRIAASMPRPTAILCANDLMAVGVILRLQELGLRVPEDVSVAGYDGIPIGEYIHPRLTTLKTAPFEIGAVAARLLLDQIAGLPASSVDVPPAELILRGSTGPLGSGPDSAPSARGRTAGPVGLAPR